MLKYVAGFIDPEEALVAQGFLRANDIPSVIQNYDHLTAQPWLRVALDGHRLLVPTEKLEEAKALLREANARVFAIEDESEIWVQPRSLRWDQYFWLPIFLLISVPFLPRPKGWLIALVAFGFWAVLIASVIKFSLAIPNMWFGVWSM